MFGYLTLATALIISLSAAVYSILGLTAIFAAAFWPIVIMGGSLEFGKIVTTLWLHKYWDRAEIQYKVYLCSAVAILMLLTSMGVFGFLSKAHTDQALVSGDVTSKIAIYDEKIKIEKDNIDANRKALKQMDEAVDQVMARSTTEGGADKAVAIRRSQQKERGRILTEIGDSQKKITTLNEQRAPIAAEVRKVEAEVGPIKYIAALVYGDNPDANVLERSVRWVIILIVIVFDPLALTLLLAATKTFEWERGVDILAPKKKEEEEEKELADEILKKGVTNTNPEDNVPLGEMVSLDAVEQQALQQALDEEYPVVQEEKKKTILAGLDSMWNRAKGLVKKDPEAEHALLEEAEIEEPLIDDHIDGTTFAEKEAQRRWKEVHPNETIKKHRALHDAGKITELPWNSEEFRRSIDTGFGKTFPDHPAKGDIFLRTDRVPTVLYRYTGTNWIPIDKDVSSSYTYNTAYIDYLIEKLNSGEYDPELLSLNEQISIEQRLNQNA